MSFLRVWTRLRQPRLRLSWLSSLRSPEWESWVQGEGWGWRQCCWQISPQEQGQQLPMQKLGYWCCCWQMWWGQKAGLEQSTITQGPALAIGFVNSFSILKACSIRMFSTSLDRQFISYFCPSSFPPSSLSAATLNFSCFISALSHRSYRERLTIFSDFSEQLERLLRLMGKCSSWLVSDLSLTERLLGSSEEKVCTVDTCWFTPLMFFLCSLLVPHSDSSSFFLRSALSMASRMLFSMRMPRKYNDLQILRSRRSRALSLPFSSFLFHWAWNSSYSSFSSPPSTMIFSPAQQQKSLQTVRRCLKKLISFERWMVRQRFYAPSSTRQLQISWMGNSLESILSSNDSSLSVLPTGLMAFSDSLPQFSSLSTNQVVASWLRRSLMRGVKWI